MEPIREAEMQTQPGKRLNEESKKSGKGPLLITGIVLAVLVNRFLFPRHDDGEGKEPAPSGEGTAPPAEK